MSKNLKTIVVTGSTGFIGKNIVEFFSDDYEILAPSHSELELLSQNDVNTFFSNHDVNYIIHCANSGGNRKNNDNPEVIDKNLRMFLNLAENHEHFEKMIHLGSGAEYSKPFMPPNVKEEYLGKFVPQDEYGFSKYTISKIIEGMDNVYCLRLFGVFGPNEDYSYKFISNSILKNFLNLPITIMQNVYFDWLYIDDLMSIISYFLLNSPVEKDFNITTGKTHDLVSIAKIINKISNKQSKIEIVNNGLNKEYSGNNQKLLKEMGNYKFITMENAIERLMEFYSSHMDELDTDIIKRDPYASKCKINLNE
jgi:GDP-L-fucose synthase